IGFGDIARELFRLLQPFDLRRAIATDPYADPESARRLGVELVPLEALLREVDILSIHCALTDETRGLLGARELALMKPSALIVTPARGPVIDQRALYEALAARRLRGAALDVFDEEPVSPEQPLLQLDNVLVSPHAVAWTEELFRDYSASVVGAVAAVMDGRI